MSLHLQDDVEVAWSGALIAALPAAILPLRLLAPWHFAGLRILRTLHSRGYLLPSRPHRCYLGLQRPHCFRNRGLIGQIIYGTLKVLIGVFQSVHLSISDFSVGLSDGFKRVSDHVSRSFNLSRSRVSVEVGKLFHRHLEGGKVTAQSSLSLGG